MIISPAEARRLERRELRARYRHASRSLNRICRDAIEPRSSWPLVMIAAAVAALAIWGLGL